MSAIKKPKIGKEREPTRTGLSIETLGRAVAENLFYLLGKPLVNANPHDLYMALAYTVRDRLLQRWINTITSFLEKEVKVVCYFSAEFLPGPHLGNNLVNLGVYQDIQRAIQELGGNLEHLTSPVDIVYNLEIDRWNGKEKLRLNLLDFEPVC